MCSADVRGGTKVALAKHLRNTHTHQDYAPFLDRLKAIGIVCCGVCRQVRPLKADGVTLGVSVVGYNTQLLGIMLLGIIPNHKPNFSFIIARLSIIPNPLGRGICNPNHWV